MPSMAPNFKMMADGAKAIANIHTAVAEFVDNSFDAKASNIQITTSGQMIHCGKLQMNVKKRQQS